MLCIAPTTQAAISLQSAAAEVVEIDSKLRKKTLREQRRLRQLEERIAKKGMDVDFSDPVRKWLWFAIFGWGLGLAILATILLLIFFGSAVIMSYGLALLIAGRISIFLGSVCFIIWVVKISF
jgi:hypothetical protein